LAWGVGLTYVGYYAASIPLVKNAAYVIAFTFMGLSVIFGIRTWRRDRRDRLESLR
jgi:membrane-associated protein